MQTCRGLCSRSRSHSDLSSVWIMLRNLTNGFNYFFHFWGLPSSVWLSSLGSASFLSLIRWWQPESISVAKWVIVGKRLSVVPSASEELLGSGGPMTTLVISRYCFAWFPLWQLPDCCLGKTQLKTFLWINSGTPRKLETYCPHKPHGPANPARLEAVTPFVVWKLAW